MTARRVVIPLSSIRRRKRRIAKGAGVDISEVNKLIKQFEQSKKMMKQMSRYDGR